MRFKVGDEVKVREDLIIDNLYNGCCAFVSAMNKCKGKVFSIIEVNSEYERYKLNTGDDWNYSSEMLELVKELEVETYEMYIDRISPNKPKQPEQVLKEQVQQIAKDNEQRFIKNNIAKEKYCENCKKYKTYFDCSQCVNYDEWEAKDFIVDYRDGHKEYITTYKLPNETKMKIILLSGKAQHGKDSAASIIKNKLESKGNKVLIAHYGDLVKYTCKTFFNWNGEKDEKGRTLLQRVGTDDIRAKYPDFWVDYVKSILDVFNGEWDYVLIPDTRFPNEIDIMKNSFDDVTSVCVVRTNFVSLLTEEQRNHRSEIALDEHIFDYYLIADDLEKLERKVDRFLGYL